MMTSGLPLSGPTLCVMDGKTEAQMETKRFVIVPPGDSSTHLMNEISPWFTDMTNWKRYLVIYLPHNKPPQDHHGLKQTLIHSNVSVG